jgi:SAM-dependent methyltransferase
MTEESAHDHIWDHFQNEAPQVFEGSHARLECIVRAVQRRTGLARPSLLNIGVGDGHLEKTAQKLHWPVHSLDPSPESVKALCALGVTAKTGRIEAIPFPDGAFDCVVASEVFEHLTPQERRLGLAEIRRTLKPGGYLIGTVPYREILAEQIAVCPECHHVFHRWGHTTAFDLAAIRDELAPYFNRVSCRRTAFVPFKGRTLGGKLKSLLRLILAKFGVAIAAPNIFFVAKKE